MYFAEREKRNSNTKNSVQFGHNQNYERRENIFAYTFNWY